MSTPKSATVKSLDVAKVQAFQGRVLSDLAAAAGVACANIGDRLGLYKIMAQSGPTTAIELAKRSGTNERYIQEWLLNQAAGGYVEFDRASGEYVLPAEHAAVLADEESDVFAAGGFQLFMALLRSEPQIAECFRSGEGMEWGKHDPNVFTGTERFFRPAYIGQLVSNWIPAIAGLQEKLEAGAKVADVGCGHGASTMVMTRAFPKSSFHGFDSHQPSIEQAAQQAERSGLSSRVSFSTFGASEFPGDSYDLIAFFDCLHDMGDPVSACRHAAQALKSDGCVMIVEPMAGKESQDNFNVVGRAFSGASVLCCTPNAMASGKHALGTIAPDHALEAVVKAGGFKHFNRVAETAVNRIFEARL